MSLIPGRSVDSGANETYDFLCLVFQDGRPKIWGLRLKKRDLGFNTVSFFETSVLQNGTCDPKNRAREMTRPPLREAANIAISTVIEECTTHDEIDAVFFVCFSEADAAVYREEFAERGLEK